MMLSPYLSISIDGLPLLQNQIKEVSLYSSVDQTLPELTFKLDDTQGTQISQLQVYVGATVGVSLINMGKDTSKEPTTIGNADNIKYLNFVITRIFDGFEHNEPKLSGYIQVWCKPSWYMYGNYQGHAYAPMKLSELIKQVCSDTNQLNELIIEDDNFNTSSDPGNVPRYKCSESDLDFIEKKLLPYTNIDDSNVFFYVDWFNAPHLTSFAKMIKQEESFLITPPTDQSDTVRDAVSKLTSSKCITEARPWSNIEIDIGNDDLKKAFGKLKMQVTLQNNQTGKVYIANQQPSVRLGSNSGDNYNSKMPLSAIKMELIEATSSDIYPNRILSDALSLARNGDTQLVDLMRLKVTFDSIVDNVDVGSTAYLLTPLRTIIDDPDNPISDADKKRTVFWLNGKWLIQSIQLNQTDGDPNKCSTIMILDRPTFQFNKKTTTLDKPAYFYQVEK